MELRNVILSIDKEKTPWYFWCSANKSLGLFQYE